MKPGATLDLLIDLERGERDRVAGTAAQARRESDAAGSTLQMLRGYRLDYDSRSPKRSAAAFDSTTVRVHESFTGRLDKAIGEQGLLADRLANASARHETALLERQQRLKALETLAERRAKAARERQQRKDQHLTDEFAIQAFLRSHPRGRKS